MSKYMLIRSTSALALALCLGAAGALLVPAWAQPKPKPPTTASQNEPDENIEENAASGKKVMTEGEKAETGKTKPKTAAENDKDPPPATPGKPATPAKPGSPGTSAPPRDR